MINVKKVIKVLLVLGIVLIGLSTTFSIYYKQQKAREIKKILPLGLTKGQSEYFAKELALTGKQYGYIKKGNMLLKEGNINGAIAQYEIAFKNAYSRATRGEAITHLSEAYEKKRDYKKALEYAILDRDQYLAEWAKGPAVERVKYLEYASKGEYDLALKYAKKTIEEYLNIYKREKEPPADYADRLNDLIAAKDYILSLKKK